MRLIARGYTYKEVAAELFISIKTVETHMSNVLRKLQLSNRTELTAGQPTAASYEARHDRRGDISMPTVKRTHPRRAFFIHW